MCETKRTRSHYLLVDGGRPPGLCEPCRYKAGAVVSTILMMRLCVFVDLSASGGADPPASHQAVAAGDSCTRRTTQRLAAHGLDAENATNPLVPVV